MYNYFYNDYSYYNLKSSIQFTKSDVNGLGQAHLFRNS
jgi:hypothetical protein